MLGTILDVWRAGRDPALAHRLQRLRFAELVAYAREHSPFYRERYSALPQSLDDPRHLEPVSKHELMGQFDAWVTDPAVTLSGVETFLADKRRVGELFLDRCVVMTTSGSTGTPAILLQTPTDVQRYEALSLVRGYWPWLKQLDAQGFRKILSHRGRGAALISTAGHYGAIALLEYRHHLRPWTARFSRAFSTLLPLSELVQSLEAFQPAFVGGYATALALIAKEQAEGRLHLSPGIIGSLGEGLAPATREAIARAFDCPVFDTYASSEGGPIAFECGHGWLHVNVDWVLLEPVDREFQPTPPGETSFTTLVTNLSNHLQPILRYDQGDRITVTPDPCPCGSPLPAIRVEGRTDDVLLLRSASGSEVAILPLSLGSVVEETPGVRSFQVLQTAPSTLRIRLEVAVGQEPPPVWAELERRLGAFLERHGAAPIELVRAPEPPERQASGKLRQVMRLSAPDRS